jgi:hypothetical protein
VCGCRVLQFLSAGLGGEGRRRLNASMPKPVIWWCSAGGLGLLLEDLRLRYCLLFPISCLPDGLEKILSSHPRGWALLWCSKPSVATAAAVIRWCWKMCCFWIRSLHLVGVDEDDGLDCALKVRCEVLPTKFWDHIVFSFIFEIVYNRFL